MDPTVSNPSALRRLIAVAMFLILLLFLSPLLVLQLPLVFYVWRRDRVIASIASAVWYPLLYAVMVWFELFGPTQAKIVVAIGLLLTLLKVVPHHWLSPSPQRRRAIRSAVRAFVAQYHDEPRWAQVHSADERECIVLLGHHCDFRPAPTSFYSVPHDSGIAHEFENTQLAWGLRPEAVVARRHASE